MSTTPRVLTLDEFERLPDRDGIQELLDGALIEMPPPRQRHSEICKNIVNALKRLVDDDRIWPEAGFVIGPHCPQPDVAVTFSGQGIERGWFSGAPMIAVEVASRGNTPDELEWKKNLYLANGAAEVWIIYDKTRTVVVHRGPHGEARSCDDSFVSVALGGAAISVRELFKRIS